MKKFHLSYDRKNEKIDSNELLKDIVIFMTTKFNADKIERPVESSLIFYLDNSIDFNSLQTDFVNEFQSKIYFVLSRVSINEKKYMYCSKKNSSLDVNFQLNLKEWKSNNRN